MDASNGRRERTKAQNRDAILAAARTVFAQMGFAAASVRDIIRATSLASGTFYNYFKSKEEVYQALRDDEALAVRPALRQARAAATTAQEFFHAGFAILFDFVLQARGESAPAETIRLRMDTPAVFAGHAELQEDIEGAIARGLLPPVDAGLLTAAMVGAGFELSERVRTAEDVAPASAFATALFLGGIAALPQAATA